LLEVRLVVVDGDLAAGEQVLKLKSVLARKSARLRQRQ
jgi:hypothetical protein